MTSSEGNDAHSPQGSSSNGTEYAHDWIDFLKKKNRTLTIVWVILLLIAIAMFVVAGMQFIRANESDGQLLKIQQKAMDLESQVALGRVSLSEAKVNAKALAGQLETLKKQNMEFMGESDAQLNLSDKLVSALKEKIVVLEEENTLVVDALRKNKVQHQRASKDTVAVKKDLQSIKKNLSSRKLAYQALVNRHRETQAEMERLALELDNASLRESTLDRRNAKLSDDVKQLTRKASDYEMRAFSLEKQLKAITSPIEMKPSAKRRPLAVPSISASSAKTMPVPSEQGTSTGVDKKPKVALSPLDFDSIAIDRP